ncbi:MAG: hypothetical protein WC794_04980 [Candidatus Doudnabacteria bacterium]|jgi:hypothetical protein
MVNQNKLNLSQKESAELLAQTVIVLEAEYDSSLALEFVKKMKKRLGSTSGISPQLLDLYRSLIFRAKFVCLDLLSEEEISKLLGEHILEYFLLPIDHVDILSQLRKSFVRFIWPPDIEPFVKRMLDCLSKNQEVFGNKSLSIFDEKNGISDGKPTVANWVKDYESFQVALRPGTDMAEKGGGNTFGRVSYLNKRVSQYGWSVSERDVILKVLELIDWLKTGWKEELEREATFSGEITPDYIKKTVEEIFANNQNSQTHGGTDSGIFFVEPIKEPPVVPAPKNQPIQKPIQEIVKLAPSPEVMAKPVVKLVNIEEVLKKKPIEEDFAAPGLKMWNNNPPQMPKKPTVDIDKKLEDLKKKVQK